MPKNNQPENLVNPSDLTKFDWTEMERTNIKMIKESHKILAMAGAGLKLAEQMTKSLGGETERDRLNRVRKELKDSPTAQ